MLFSLGQNEIARVPLYTRAAKKTDPPEAVTDGRVLSANGLYDFVTPFYQTVIDLQQMPLEDQKVRQNLSARFYPSGHMVYAHEPSLKALHDSVAGFIQQTDNVAH